MGNHDHQVGKAIIQFDLSGLPKEAHIVSATLTLFCEEVFARDPNSEFLVYQRISTPWDKTKVSLNVPPQTSQTDAVKTGWPNPNQPYNVDIMSFARGWHQGTFPNHGILGFAEIKTHSCAIFTSSNLYPNIIASHKMKLGQVPKITVVYQGK